MPKLIDVHTHTHLVPIFVYKNRGSSISNQIVPIPFLWSEITKSRILGEDLNEIGTAHLTHV
ncbi:MAG: hypothetical protein A2846_03955 [Candidatus Doudnabacteria bacterium RIFCSPHIGHO2_01_FULL_49_9]|uniref:Uncharacterized protein n=1 Tax=Candidatus Doudnabacteria bacterium RIFCSPHIGHO2_01_FULL_49_9 TaxID=1817827 RepID=A0A1F5P2N6_9BACT|nr:MAG: hypothetical protein A2846_03955 [Candidatus Doudnabacteria bacterium RIFCSPHIGHO2_01_FULL_49_9]